MLPTYKGFRRSQPGLVPPFLPTSSLSKPTLFSKGSGFDPAHDYANRVESKVMGALGRQRTFQVTSAGSIFTFDYLGKNGVTLKTYSITLDNKLTPK